MITVTSLRLLMKNHFALGGRLMKTASENYFKLGDSNFFAKFNEGDNFYIILC